MKRRVCGREQLETKGKANAIRSFSSISWAPALCQVPCEGYSPERRDPGPALRGLATPQGSQVLHKDPES